MKNKRSIKKRSFEALKFSSKVVVKMTILLMGATLGVHYIQQKDLVIHPMNPIYGYALIFCVVALLVLYLMKIVRWIRRDNNVTNTN